jgi:preprotein translocase subunit SecA
MTPEIMRQAERAVMLQVLDQQWKEHLARMDYLRQGIHLRGYAQKQPKQEFKREAFELFTQMLDRVKEEVVGIMLRLRLRSDDEIQAMEQQQAAKQQARNLSFQHADAAAAGFGGGEGGSGAEGLGQPPASAVNVQSGVAKVGRNEPCPCGSGQKYKQCHGKLA